MNGFVIVNGTMTLINLIQFAKTGSNVFLISSFVASVITGILYENKTK